MFTDELKDRRMKKVLISGTGTIAKALAHHLDKKGYRVNFLSTSKSYYGKFPCFHWDISKGTIDPAAFADVEHIIHLAGAGIADKKWSTERKALLESSRVDGAKLILSYLKKLNIGIKTFVSASGSNYYGTVTRTDSFREEEEAGNDFIGQLCECWERAAFDFNEIGARVAVLRTGIVLSTQGGALPRLTKIAKWFLAAPIGSGKQIMPWIHIEDLCAMYAHVIENKDCSGPYNAASTEKVCNRYFTRCVAKIAKRPVWPIGVPAFLLKLLYGEMAGLLLYGTHLENKRIVSSGFSFRYTKLLDAIEDVIQRKI